MFATAKKLPVMDKAITEQMSLAKQANERAIANLHKVMCDTFDGPDCNCHLEVKAEKPQ